MRSDELRLVNAATIISSTCHIWHRHDTANENMASNLRTYKGHADNTRVCQPQCYCAVRQQFRVRQVMDILYYP